MIFIKGTQESTKFQIFNCSGEISPILYFDRILLLKVYKTSAKKEQKSYASWYWRVTQNLVKKRFVVSKTTRIWWILMRALKVSKMCTLNGLFHAKYITFDLKKCRRLIFHDTEESCKIWIKTDVWFGKLHEDFSKYFIKTVENVKIGIFMEYLSPKWKRMS